MKRQPTKKKKAIKFTKKDLQKKVVVSKVVWDALCKLADTVYDLQSEFLMERIHEIVDPVLLNEAFGFIDDFEKIKDLISRTCGNSVPSPWSQWKNSEDFVEPNDVKSKAKP